MVMKPMDIGSGYRELDLKELVPIDAPGLETVWNGAWTPLAKIQLGAVSKSQEHLFRAKSPYTYKEWKALGWGIRRPDPSPAKQELAAVWEATGHPLPFLGTSDKDMFPGHQDAPKPFTPNKYTRTLHTLDGRKVPVDVYCVLAAFPTGSAAIDHAVKKLLAPGARGVKSRLQDIKEAHASLGRAIELEEGQDASP